MKRLAVLLVPTLLLVGCVQVFGQRQREYYMTRQPWTYADSTTDSARVNIVDRQLGEIGTLVVLSRRRHYEEVGCFEVRSDSSEFWMIGDIQAPTYASRVLPDQVDYSCPKGWGSVHIHWMSGEQCAAGRGDTSPVNAKIPVQLVACGIGIDSLIAYRAKPRPLGAPTKANLGSFRQ